VIKVQEWDEMFVSAPQVVFYKNTFYLFYMGGNEAGRMAVGLATSRDGFNFTKFEGNPLLVPDSAGFDIFTLGPGIILKEDTGWVRQLDIPITGMASSRKDIAGIRCSMGRRILAFTLRMRSSIHPIRFFFRLIRSVSFTITLNTTLIQEEKSE